MSLQIGDSIPDATLTRMGAQGPEAVTTGELFGGRKVVLFALPGAFTPTCSARHLPGFVAHAAAIRAKGVDDVVCLSVNDAFVMDAWGQAHGAGGKVTMLGDGNADFTKAAGLGQDRSDRGMGLRSRRYAMIVEDGVVTALEVEPAPALDVSKAEAVLALLG